MVQNHANVTYSREDAVRLHPVWPEPIRSHGRNSKLGKALDQLERALTDCDTALATAIAALTSEDLSSALRSLPAEPRSLVLNLLGLRIKPRQITQSLSQDVRSRMRRLDVKTARIAAVMLTAGPSTDLMRFVFVKEREGKPLSDPCERWGPGLCRLAMWSSGLASAMEARMWLWAVQQPWFQADGISDEQLEAIVESCEQVVVASPDFVFPVTTGVNGELDRGAASEDADDEPDAHRELTDLELEEQVIDAAGMPEVAEVLPREPVREGGEDVNTASAMSEGVLSTIGTVGAQDQYDDYDDLAAAGDALAAQIADGLRAAQDMVQMLREERPRPERTWPR